MTTVVNIRHQEYDVKICRGTLFGNPFLTRKYRDKEMEHRERMRVIALYRKQFYIRLEKEPGFREKVEALKGKRLGCYCKQPDRELPCYGDVIVQYLERGKNAENGPAEKDAHKDDFPKQEIG